MAEVLFPGQSILFDYSSSFTSKFASEKPLLVTSPVLVLVVTAVHALTVVQFIHESLAFLEVFPSLPCTSRRCHGKLGGVMCS